MSRPWMALYVADYLADTMHLSALESGAYMLLIMHYWQHQQLPNDDAKLARITKLSKDEWLAIRDTMASFFGPNWMHKRIDQELAEAEAKYEKRASAGKKGGTAAASSRRSNAAAMLHQPQPPSPKKEVESRARATVEIASQETTPKREPLIPEAAIAIAEEFRKAVGIDRDELGWSGLDYDAAVWIARGYDRATVLSTGAAIATRKPLKPKSYFLACVHRACTEPIAPTTPRPPVPPSKSAEVIHVQRPNNIAEAGRRRLAELRELKAGLDRAGDDARQGDAGDGEGKPDVPLLSQGGSG